MRSAIAIFAALAWSLTAFAQETPSPDQPGRAKQAAAPSGQGGIPFGSHNKNAPINVSSDNFEGDLQTKVGIYTGNVVVTQADYKLRSDKLRVEVVDGKPNRLFAYGNVVFVSASGTATGDNAVYDLGPATVTLTGKVVLTKGKDVMRGTLLVVNTNTGLAHLTAKGMPGGRVQSTFVPKSDGGRKDEKSGNGATE